MNILFTTQNMRERAGSKTYAVSCARSMAKLGHTITFVTGNTPDGPMGQLAAEVGEVILYADLPGRQFDIAYVSPNPCYAPEIREASERIVSISHGRVSAEQPVVEADAYVFVSEEVYQYWTGRVAYLQNKNFMIIRNPIETDIWTVDEITTGLERVAYVSNYENIEWMEAAVRDAGLDFVRVKHQHPDKVRFDIERSQLIIATGRSCYEAMSCGREVLILDNRPYNADMVGHAIVSDGLASETYDRARQVNCSGRTAAQEYTREEFATVLATVLARTVPHLQNCGLVNKNYIRLYHDADEVAAALLSVGNM